ncbi:MAG: hypothetical protein GY803_18330, partial [Chloroflexi bacterium]|nr:hypothetical protein [Chloroflexota bacterium]
MKRLSAYKLDFLLIVGFLLLPLSLYASVTLGDKMMIPADNLFQWQPWAGAAEELGVETPQNGLLTDLVIENHVWKRFFVESVKRGELPLWQPYLFGGSPFLATGQHSMLYPFSWLFLILPIAKAYGWYTVSQLWLAGALMYVYGRSLSLRRSSAFIAGLVYQGSGFMLASAAVFPMIIGAAAWLPLLLACIEKIIYDLRFTIDDLAGNRQSSIVNRQSSTVLWVALGAVALGMNILAGHIEITYYSLLLMGLYALWRLFPVLRSQIHATFGRRHKFMRPSVAFTILRPAGWLLAMVLLGLLLGSVQLIPFVEVGQANFREGSASFAEVRDWAFKPRRILTLALPNFFGNPAHHEVADVISGETVPFQTAYDGTVKNNSEWGLKNYVEGGIYLGILPLFLAIFGATGGWWLAAGENRRSHAWFFSLLSLLSLAFIFGTPLYALIYYGLPFANQLHTPFRWVFPLSLAVAVLAGLGMEYLAITRKRHEIAQTAVSWASNRNISVWLRPFVLWGTPSWITASAGMAFWSGLVLLAGLFVSRGMYGRFAPTIERIFLGLAGASSTFPDARAFYSYEFRQLFILGLILVGTGTVLRVSRCPIFIKLTPIYLFMAATILTLDLFLANFGFNSA